MLSETDIKTLTVLSALLRRNIQEGRRVREVVADATALLRKNFSVVRVGSISGVMLRLVEKNAVGKPATGVSSIRPSYEALENDLPYVLAEALEAVSAGLQGRASDSESCPTREVAIG